jgi:hypothetical protein
MRAIARQFAPPCNARPGHTLGQKRPLGPRLKLRWRRRRAMRFCHSQHEVTNVGDTTLQFLVVEKKYQPVSATSQDATR